MKAPPSLPRKDRCSGCEACANACPRDAIRMEPDAAGFPFPRIDPQRCVGCGLCRSVCPFRNASRRKATTDGERTPRVFAVQRKDESGLLGSSSGGAASLLAESVVESGGIAFGAAFDESFSEVRHRSAGTVEETVPFRKSKYVQSRIGDAFRRVKSALEAGSRVAFFGTPCQVAGLLAFLGNRPERLLAVDFFCHGVPSPLLFRKYVEWLGTQLGGAVRGFDFRDKRRGWNVWVSVRSKEQEVVRPADRDPYMVWFLKHHSIRGSCLACPFRNGRSPADVTVGDFWRIRPNQLDADVSKGVSKVVLRTDRGVEAFESVRNRTFANEQGSFSGAAYKQPKAPVSRSAFLRDVPQLGIEGLIRRYPSRADRLQESIRRFWSKASGFVRTRFPGTGRTARIER